MGIITFADGRAVGAATAVSLSCKVPLFYGKNGSGSGSASSSSSSWISGALALPAAGFVYTQLIITLFKRYVHFFHYCLVSSSPIVHIIYPAFHYVFLQCINLNHTTKMDSYDQI